MSLSIAPHLRMFYSSLLTNSLSVLIPHISATSDLQPMNIRAALLPVKMAEALLKTVSIATASLQWLALHAVK
jgi:hypothetical protein